MAKMKAKKTYALSRAKIAKKLEKISNKLAELDLSETTPNELDNFLWKLGIEVADLAADAVAEAD